MEMVKLMRLLRNAKIPYEVQDCWGTPQIGYPNFGDGLVCDVICHAFSYGGNMGLLEIMGLVDETIEDTVEGYLTAEEVFSRIQKHYQDK